MTVEPGYYIRRKQGFSDAKSFDLHLRLKEGEPVKVWRRSSKSYVSFVLLDKHQGQTLPKNVFNIYFRKPTEEELALLLLRELDS